MMITENSWSVDLHLKMLDLIEPSWISALWLETMKPCSARIFTATAMLPVQHLYIFLGQDPPQPTFHAIWWTEGLGDFFGTRRCVDGSDPDKGIVYMAAMARQFFVTASLPFTMGSVPPWFCYVPEEFLVLGSSLKNGDCTISGLFWWYTAETVSSSSVRQNDSSYHYINPNYF